MRRSGVSTVAFLCRSMYSAREAKKTSSPSFVRSMWSVLEPFEYGFAARRKVSQGLE